MATIHNPSTSLESNNSLQDSSPNTTAEFQYLHLAEWDNYFYEVMENDLEREFNSLAEGSNAPGNWPSSPEDSKTNQKLFSEFCTDKFFKHVGWERPSESEDSDAQGEGGSQLMNKEGIAETEAQKTPESVDTDAQGEGNGQLMDEGTITHPQEENTPEGEHTEANTYGGYEYQDEPTTPYREEVNSPEGVYTDANTEGPSEYVHDPIPPQEGNTPEGVNTEAHREDPVNNSSIDIITISDSDSSGRSNSENPDPGNPLPLEPERRLDLSNVPGGNQPNNPVRLSEGSNVRDDVRNSLPNENHNGSQLGPGTSNLSLPAQINNPNPQMGTREGGPGTLNLNLPGQVNNQDHQSRIEVESSNNNNQNQETQSHIAKRRRIDQSINWQQGYNPNHLIVGQSTNNYQFQGTLAQYPQPADLINFGNHNQNWALTPVGNFNNQHYQNIFNNINFRFPPNHPLEHYYTNNMPMANQAPGMTDPSSQSSCINLNLEKRPHPRQLVNMENFRHKPIMPILKGIAHPDFSYLHADCPQRIFNPIINTNYPYMGKIIPSTWGYELSGSNID